MPRSRSPKERAERRAARGLLSDAAGIILREQVLDDPALVGGTQRVALPVSDTVDLYLKGMIVEPEPLTVAGPATPSAVSGGVTVQLDREATARVRDDLSATLRAQAGRLSREASRTSIQAEGQTRNVARLQTSLAEADQGVRAAIEAELAAAQATLTTLQGDLQSLQQRSSQLLAEADASDSESKLTADSPSYFLHLNGGTIKVTGVSQAGVSGEALVPLTSTAPAPAGTWRLERLGVPESARQISDREIAYIEVLQAAGAAELRFNWLFFTRGASREPEMAGILGAVVGSFLTLIVTLALSFPIGVAAAVYLEEFAPKNRWTDADRGQHQQPRGGALDRLRPARPCRLPELLRPAAFGAARRRHGAGADDAADHHHRLARGAEGGAAVDPRGGARHRRVEAPDRVPPRAAAGACPAS